MAEQLGVELRLIRRDSDMCQGPEEELALGTFAMRRERSETSTKNVQDPARSRGPCTYIEASGGSDRSIPTATDCYSATVTCICWILPPSISNVVT
jgi:hypothetical protein